ncbi:hypothetical protein FJV83_24500 [Mesorhizobium sp. WSM4307]|uniref:hypothetical protein n=1 Tax=unclassified Mesorhizobium TaxID=325217 RepID=UPI00115DAEF0|nr:MULTISPECIES: hypothetical protein [unclassified Mesorhizobium]TRC76828.1 hypothetical protein FJV81_14460 [Mesorhizobium sp. WSM4315]TRC81339.1 hypothetical protein FJV83_24500 [Mesorhizobium sp. WSM4307]
MTISTFACIAFPFAAFLFDDETNLIALCNSTKLVWLWQCNGIETAVSGKTGQNRSFRLTLRRGKVIPGRLQPGSATPTPAGRQIDRGAASAFCNRQGVLFVCFRACETTWQRHFGTGANIRILRDFPGQSPRRNHSNFRKPLHFNAKYDFIE